MKVFTIKITVNTMKDPGPFVKVDKKAFVKKLILL